MIKNYISKITPFTLGLILLGALVTHAAPIKIGVSLGLTGEYALRARMQEQGFRLWEKHVNEKGGILGRPVRLIIYDDQNDKATAVKYYQQMIEQEKIDFLFGPYSTPITMAILPVTEKYAYPVLLSGAAGDVIYHQGYRYVFGTYIPLSRYALGFFELMAANNIKKVAAISTRDLQITAFSRLEEWIDRLGLEYVYKNLEPGTLNYEQLVHEVKESGAQALIFSGSMPEAIQMRMTLKEMNWHPEVYWPTASNHPGYTNRLGGLAENAFSVSVWKYFDKLPFPGSKQFYDAFTTAYKMEPAYQAATAYAAGEILKAAIEQAGTTDRESVTKALRIMDITTLIGRYKVDKTGMQISHFSLVLQWIKGSHEIVWPPQLRTAEPIFP